MKLLFAFLAFVIATISVAQSETQLIVYSKLSTDGSFKNGEFWYRVIDNRIVYTYDSLIQRFISDKYQISAFEDIGMDSLNPGILKRYYKTYNHAFSPAFFADLKRELETDKFVKTPKDSIRTLFLHTSHHYQNLYVTIIENNDTANYYKSKPFNLDTPWYKDGKLTVNTTIDKMISEILPNDFLLRKQLDPYRNFKSEDYTSEWVEFHKTFKKYWKRGKVTPLK